MKYDARQNRMLDKITVADSLHNEINPITQL